MSSKRFEGKNLEEALENAARSFGVERYRVSYHVVLEKRGFLGGTKRVVIEADLSDAPVRKPETVEEKRPVEKRTEAKRPERGTGGERKPRREKRTESAEERDETPPRREKQSASDEEERGSRRGRRRGGRGRGRRDRGEQSGEKRPAPDKAVQRKEQPPRPVTVEPPAQGEQSADAAKVAEWCQEIFRLSRLDLVARTTETDEEISVELFGSDVPIVEEDVADYLDSLQVLANKSFTGRSVERRIEFDAGGFKERREAELREHALEIADQVREEGRERTMRAMSPIERRIVHVTLENERGVSTESRGRGFHKRVAIIPADDDRAAASES